MTQKDLSYTIQYKGKGEDVSFRKLWKENVMKMSKNTKLEIEVVKTDKGYSYFLSNPCFTEYKIHGEQELFEELLTALKICREIAEKEKEAD